MLLGERDHDLDAAGRTSGTHDEVEHTLAHAVMPAVYCQISEFFTLGIRTRINIKIKLSNRHTCESRSF